MNARTRAFAKARLLAACATLALFVFASNASASVTRIHFSGAAGNGYADLTLQPAASNDVIDPGKPPLAITGASGAFNGATITGVQVLNHATPPPDEVLPASYSLFSIPGYGDHDGVSYDNLFYPMGSPMLCLLDGTPLYPFSGGFLDIMGVMFTLDNGSFVDLWSFGLVDPAAGEFPPFVSGLTYGLKVIQPNGTGGYEVMGFPPFATASVPEPNLFWLFGVTVLGVFAWRRSTKKSGCSATERKHGGPPAGGPHWHRPAHRPDSRWAGHLQYKRPALRNRDISPPTG